MKILSKINGEYKDNELVNEVITFIEKDKKRPICSPQIKIIMIGLIFGETDFPKQILKKIKKKEKYLIIDLTKNKIFKKDKNSYSVSIGQFGKIINILKKIIVRKFLFAGKVKSQIFLN